MQIDFHHAVTYVVARLAGFSYNEAATIAHAAQYVDDATNAGELQFDNGAGYCRIASAHKMLDYTNFNELANARVWIPFHFLPGNGGLPAGKSPKGEFFNALICRPNSPPAQEMVQRCIQAHDAPYALHRLGITMHVYADTWAHQGFVGITHKVNLVHGLTDDDNNPTHSFSQRLKTYFKDKAETLASGAIGVKPLGHGAALSHPDMPFLTWRYTDGLKNKIERNNPADFLTAVKHMFARMVEYRRAAGATDTPAQFPPQDLEQIRKNFASFTNRDGDHRHEKWSASIKSGQFSFGNNIPSYIAKGPGSWKDQAIGDVDDKQSRTKHTYTANFLKSDWKHFHDALQVHRLVVLHEILPNYGISVA